MCKCTPEMRTPFCGKPGCEAPAKKTLFCVTCAHHREDGALHVCDLPETDLVTGETVTLGLPCGDERSWRNQRPGGCGPEGKNWKARG